MAARKKMKADNNAFIAKLDELHTDIIANQWTHLDAQDVSQSLNLYKSCDFDQPISESGENPPVTQERDICLVKLSIIMILFDKLCSSEEGRDDKKKLQEICGRLLHHDYKLLESLGTLLGSGDQLVSYTACKTAASVVVSFQMQPFPSTWLDCLLQQVKESPHSSRAVCTFDLFKLVIRRLGSSVPSMPGEAVCATVREDSCDWAVGVCFSVLGESWKQLVQLYMKNYQPLSEAELSCQPPTSSEEGESAFLAFLSLWMECLNCDTERETFYQCYSGKDLLDLFPALKCTKSPLVYTNILEILLQSFQLDLKEQGVNATMLTKVASTLLKAFDEEMMERVPWQNKHVGFGGTQFVAVQLLTGQKPGDWVLVRTLVLVLLKAGSMVSGLGRAEESVNIATTLQRLSSFVNKKLATSSGAPSSHDASGTHDASFQAGSWLFELFSDQDDSMVEAMLCLMDIHTAISRSVTHSPHADILMSFSPHQVFLQFLETTTWDHSILLDLLISMETSFLAYITRYLHLVIAEWQMFCDTNQLYGATVDICGSSNGDVEEQRKGVTIPDSPGGGQGGKKNYDGYHLPQPDHIGKELLTTVDTHQDEKNADTRGQEMKHEKGTIMSKGEGLIPDCHEQSGTDTLTTQPLLLHSFHLCGKPSKVFSTQHCEKQPDTVQETSDSELEINHALELETVIPGHGEIVDNTDSFDTEIAGEQLQALVAQQSTIPKDQDLDVVHESQTEESSEGEKDESISQLSDDSSSSSDNDEEESTLDKTMGVLIRLRLAVERLSDKKLFPYNVTPLLRLLTTVEAMYEEE